MSRCLKLLVIHSKQVSLGLLDVEKHLFAQLLSLFDPIQLLLVDLLKSEILLTLEPLLQVLEVFIKLGLDRDKVVDLVVLALQVSQLVIQLLDLKSALLIQVVDLLLILLLLLGKLGLQSSDLLLHVHFVLCCFLGVFFSKFPLI